MLSLERLRKKTENESQSEKSRGGPALGLNKPDDGSLGPKKGKRYDNIANRMVNRIANSLPRRLSPPRGREVPPKTPPTQALALGSAGNPKDFESETLWANFEDVCDSVRNEKGGMNVSPAAGDVAAEDRDKRNERRGNNIMMNKLAISSTGQAVPSRERGSASPTAPRIRGFPATILRTSNEVEPENRWAAMEDYGESSSFSLKGTNSIDDETKETLAGAEAFVSESNESKEEEHSPTQRAQPHDASVIENKSFEVSDAFAEFEANFSSDGDQVESNSVRFLDERSTEFAPDSFVQFDPNRSEAVAVKFSRVSRTYAKFHLSSEEYDDFNPELCEDLGADTVGNTLPEQNDSHQKSQNIADHHELSKTVPSTVDESDPCPEVLGSDDEAKQDNVSDDSAQELSGCIEGEIQLTLEPEATECKGGPQQRLSATE